MKRIVLLAGALALALAGLVGIGPAHADFHGLCTAGTNPTAYVHLSLSGSTVTWSGTVNCVGTLVSIGSLSFRVNGQEAGGGAGACVSCSGPLTITGTYQQPGGPEVYSLKMAFTVRTATVTNPVRYRTEQAVWAGTGTLRVICGGTDQANQQNSCPVVP